MIRTATDDSVSGKRNMPATPEEIRILQDLLNDHPRPTTVQLGELVDTLNGRLQRSKVWSDRSVKRT